MQAGPETLAWFDRYYAAIDSFDFEALAGFLAPDVRAVAATGVETVGREQIIARGRATYGRMDRLRHELRNVWEQEGDQWVFELEVTYWRPDGEVLSRPGMGIFVVRDGLVHEQRLFVDNGAVYAGIV